jgi:hypothetical protein
LLIGWQSQKSNQLKSWGIDFRQGHEHKFQFL